MINIRSGRRRIVIDIIAVDAEMIANVADGRGQWFVRTAALGYIESGWCGGIRW